MTLDLSKAVLYHLGQFPPELGYERLMRPLLEATAALARYDQMLRSIHNSRAQGLTAGRGLSWLHRMPLQAKIP